MTGYEAWSTTPGSNSNVEGTSATNIAENNLPATINNALREVLANVAILRDMTGGAKVSAGTADAQTLDTDLPWTAYQQGILVAFEAGATLTNTGAMTMDIDSIGAKSVKLVNGVDPAAGAITAGGIYLLAYESGSDTLLLLNPTPGSTSPGIDDNATGERLQLANASVGWGDASSGEQWQQHLRTTTDGIHLISGGSAVALGGNLVLWGEAHATAAGDWALRDDTAAILAYDKSDNEITSSVRIVTNGQLEFPATQNASADANTLDDYEEGTWTPAITFGGGSTGVTYSSQAGRYNKIGRAVLIEAQLVLSAKGSSTGSAVITGLPFTVTTSPAPLALVASGLTSGIGDTTLMAWANSSSTDVQLYYISTGNQTALDEGDFTDTTSYRLSGAYSV